MKAVIFDFDGVIIDSENRRLEILKILLKKSKVAGIQYSKLALKFIKGKKTGLVLDELKIPKNVSARIIEKKRLMELKSWRSYVLLDDIEPLLKFLKSKKIKIGLCTGSNSLFVLMILKRFGICEYFDYQNYTKDYPDVMKTLDVRPCECLVIEDSIEGFLKGLKSGAFVVFNR